MLGMAAAAFGEEFLKSFFSEAGKEVGKTWFRKFMSWVITRLLRRPTDVEHLSVTLLVLDYYNGYGPDPSTVVGSVGKILKSYLEKDTKICEYTDRVEVCKEKVCVKVFVGYTTEKQYYNDVYGISDKDEDDSLDSDDMFVIYEVQVVLPESVLHRRDSLRKGLELLRCTLATLYERMGFSTALHRKAVLHIVFKDWSKIKDMKSLLDEDSPMKQVVLDSDGRPHIYISAPPAEMIAEIVCNAI